jgi:hypothetical protein
MGGSYFAFNMIASQVSCWIAASLYVANYTGKNKLDDITIYAFIGALQVVWALALVLFSSKIKRAYWKTFYSTQSGRQCTMACFLDNEDDASRMIIFSSHEDLYSDIKDELKEYTLKNWARWEMEKSAWFDDNLKALVPDEYIPKAALDDLNRLSLAGKRRRSIVLGMVGGDVGGGACVSDWLTAAEWCDEWATVVVSSDVSHSYCLPLLLSLLMKYQASLAIGMKCHTGDSSAMRLRRYMASSSTFQPSSKSAL